VTVVYACILIALVAWTVLPPLFRRRTEGSEDEGRAEELEARKEAKYRELRDTELDYAAGKLSEEDYQHRLAVLRGEAAEILAEVREG
jgi:hypothetical protein